MQTLSSSPEQCLRTTLRNLQCSSRDFGLEPCHLAASAAAVVVVVVV